MLVLSLSTVLNMVVVVLYDTSVNKFVIRHVVSPYSSLECLFPLIQELLQQYKCSCADLDRIAVINGPGRFTNIRVAVSAAKGLALVHNTPVVAVTLPFLVSWLLRTTHNCYEKICVLVPGVGDKFYAQTINKDGSVVSDIQLLDNINLVDELLEADCIQVECGYEEGGHPALKGKGVYCVISYESLALFAVEAKSVHYEEIELVYGKHLILDKHKLVC